MGVIMMVGTYLQESNIFIVYKQIAPETVFFVDSVIVFFHYRRAPAVKYAASLRGGLAGLFYMPQLGGTDI